jgi:cholest-4-en-3-one 26-monooxygenase
MTPSFRFEDPQSYVTGTPYHEFARLRAEAPFAWNPPRPGLKTGYWLATKHRDIAAISKRPAEFSTKAPLLQEPIPERVWPDFPALAMIANNLLTFDPQKHPTFRSLVSQMMSQRTLAEREPEIRALCSEMLQRIPATGRFDFAEQVALPFPVAVVLSIVLGVPRADQDALARCILAINAMEDPQFCRPPNGLMEAAEELYAYGKRHVERLLASGGSGILGGLLQSSAVEEISREALFLAYWFPMTAGAFDTTAATLAGGVHALLRFPEQLERLKTNPALIPLAVEEMLRWVSPAIYFRRTAASETTFDGKLIRKGDPIVLCYASANRDEEVFQNPDSFDVARNPNAHVSFGYGPHYCIGASLARAMLRIFLEEFISRGYDLRLDGEVVHTRSNWMNRIWSMPVRTEYA